MPVYPGTTVSSGPGPPQVKQVPITLMCTKLPSEQVVTFDQSTAKTVNLNMRERERENERISSV